VTPKAPKLRTYRVGTFYYDDVIGKVLCYLRVYRPGSPGCVEFDVQATSGTEAKKIAHKKRRELEEKRNAENT
jgi:hypothetical protein